MNGYDGTGNIESRDVWQTNQELWIKLNKQYKFTFDCCADETNNKTKHFTTNFESIGFLPCETLWMNPPFTKAYKMFEHYFKVCVKGVAIYRCDNLETKVWQNIIFKFADWIMIFKGRINYDKFDNTIKTNVSRFPSALIGIGVKPPENIKGTILYLKSKHI